MRGDGRIVKRPQSRYPWIAYYHRGVEVRESAAGAIREVEARKGRKLSDDEAMRAAGQFLKRRVHEVWAEREGTKPFLGPERERIKVNELLDDLVGQYKLGGKKRIPRELSASLRSHLKHVRDYFGEMRAVAVTQRQGENFIDLLKSRGKANATINRATQLLRQAFKMAAAADPPKVLRPLTIAKLDESENVRQGKFTEREAQQIFSSLRPYLADVARFAYETGCRAGEILKLRWEYLQKDALQVPAKLTKTRTARSIALTPELEAIVLRRRAAHVKGCDLIFHHNGRPIKDYRKAWWSACCINGLGKFFCRNCRDDDGAYTSALDVERRCPKCGQKCERPKYVGRLFHDFRRSAAYEMWKAGSTVEECIEVTGHKSQAMFKRYADLFSDEERRNRQREVQRRRREWRQEQAHEIERLPDAPSVRAVSKPGVSERVQ